jgi:hypothetical protein
MTDVQTGVSNQPTGSKKLVHTSPSPTLIGFGHPQKRLSHVMSPSLDTGTVTGTSC